MSEYLLLILLAVALFELAPLLAWLLHQQTAWPWWALVPAAVGLALGLMVASGAVALFLQWQWQRRYGYTRSSMQETLRFGCSYTVLFLPLAGLLAVLATMAAHVIWGFPIGRTLAAAYPLSLVLSLVLTGFLLLGIGQVANLIRLIRAPSQEHP